MSIISPTLVRHKAKIPVSVSESGCRHKNDSSTSSARNSATGNKADRGTKASAVYRKLRDDHPTGFSRSEECKEAILAYYFLLKATGPLTAQELDSAIENWFSTHQQHELDFEIADAIDKLLKLGLITQTANRFTAVSLDQARKILDTIWDDYYAY